MIPTSWFSCLCYSPPIEADWTYSPTSNESRTETKGFQCCDYFRKKNVASILGTPPLPSFLLLLLLLFFFILLFVFLLPLSLSSTPSFSL